MELIDSNVIVLFQQFSFLAVIQNMLTLLLNFSATTMRKKYIFLLLFTVLPIALGYAQNFVFAELQGTPTINTTGWNLTGNAQVGNTNGTPGSNNDEVILTANANAQSGGIFWDEPLDLNICSKWTVEFDFRIFDGSGADGLAFCFLDVPPAGFVSGGGVGIPGGSNGLKVIFDTYDNCGGANPQIQIYTGVGYNECIAGIIKAENNGGTLDFIRRNEYNSAVITYDAGDVTVSVNGNQYLTGFAPANFVGYMGFTASTGGSNDNHSIRNAIIYTDQAISDAGPDVEICSGEQATIGSSNNSDYVYSWTPTSGLSDASIANPEITLSNNGTSSITEEFVVETSLAEDPGVCPTTDTVNVTIHPNPLAQFDASLEVCQGNASTITFTGEQVDNTTFDWNVEGASSIDGENEGPISATWQNTGNFDITLTLMAEGCESEFSTTVTVNPVSNSLEQETVCDEISWNGETYTSSGTYTFETLNTFGCDSTVVLNLTVNESKETQLNEEVCDSYVAPDGQTLTTTGEYTYVFQAENGCDSTVFLDIIIYPTPEVSFTSNPEEGYAVQDVEFTNNSANASTNFWDFGDGTTSENNNGTVNHTYVDPGEYLVTLEGINGICSEEFETVVVILMPEATFEVPNVFTPNSDGVNDEFKLTNIVGEENISAFDISIVNRWGNVVKEFNQYDFLWDGTNSSGTKCTEGVYFYKITLTRKDEQEFTYNGFVHLVGK